MVSKEVFHQSTAVIPAILNDLAEGISYAWVAPTILTLKKTQEFSLTTTELSWLGSSQEFGKMLGPLLGALLVDRIGRKTMLMLCATIFISSWLAISLATSILVICIARYCFGAGMGMNDTTTSIYLGENFSPRLRAIFCSVALLAFYMAELIEFIIASMYSFRTVAVINAFIAFVGLLTIYFSKETPQYLLMKRKLSEAEKNYKWLRCVENIETDLEFTRMKNNVEEERTKQVSYRKLLSAKANYRSLFIVTFVCAFTSATGGIALLSYLSMLFSDNEALTPYQFVILFGVVKLFVSASLPFYVEKLRRRTFIVGTFFMIAMVHFTSAILYYVHMRVSPIPHFSWVIFSTVTLYSSIFSVLSPLKTMIRGELFPQSVKALGGFIAISLHSAVAFFVTKTFLAIKENYGPEMNFLFFSGMSFFAFVVTYFKLPETRGKTLVEIQEALEK